LALAEGRRAICDFLSSDSFFITAKPDHFHYFYIGIYDSKETANDALNQLKDKPGFSLRPNAFRIHKVIRFRTPRFLNNTYWIDGFETYTYTK
jgi:hypothetical protein